MTALLKITYKAGALLMAACAGLIVCSSCTDEEFMKGSGKTDKLSFGVSISDKWNAGPTTRSTENNGPKYEAYKFDNSDMWIIASEEEGIKGHVLLDTMPLTRGTAVTTTNFESLCDKFGVYAYVLPSTENDWNQQQAQTYIDNDEVVKEGDVWQNTPLRFWPGDKYNMKFFAYAPWGIPFTRNEETNAPQLTYQVPEKAEEQRDLLTTWTGKVTGNKNDLQDLVFHHILSAVKVKIDDDDRNSIGNIQSVKISGIYGTADYDSSEGEKGCWKNLKDKNKTYTSTYETGKDEDANIVYGEHTFMLLPQDLDKEVKLEITILNSDKTTHTLTGYIGGVDTEGKLKRWEMGCTYIYRISWNSTSEEYIFEVTPKEKAFNEAGGNLQYEVKSYKRISNGSRVSYEAVPWYVDPATSTGYALFPEWSIKDHNSIRGNGINDPNKPESKNLDILSYRITDMGLNMPKDENSKDWDLSLPLPRGTWDKDGNPINQNTQTTDQSQRSTSNCYMVFAQDHHRFPLVYGNAIKNGKDNKQAYKDFVNHAGKKITSPFIERNEDEEGNKINVTSVELLWQDSPRLINSTEVTLEHTQTPIQVDGKTEYVRYIKFQPFPSYYVQGNAVIVAKSKNTVVWSWHIWFTNYRGDDTFTGAHGYEFMNHYLGWCAKQPITSQRTATLHFIQERSGKTQDIQITQSGSNGIISYQGSCPVYQWGRKDALPGIQDGNNGYVYEGAEAGVNIGKFGLNIKNSFGSKAIKDGIEHPDVFYSHYNNWLKNTSENLWNVGNAEKAVKTVYDPSPRGFMVPPKCAYDNFGQGSNKGNKYEEWVSNGQSFYYTNYRQYTGGLMYQFDSTPSYAFLWTSTFNNNGHSSTFTSNGITDEIPQAQGNPILPVKEKD